MLLFMRKRIRFGAAHDRPGELIDTAIAEAKAYHGGDSFKLRRAAETGWLAASSAADVAAKRLGERHPKGYDGRHATLEKLEKRAKLRHGSLTAPLLAARGTLHGDCFHDDVCSPATIRSTLLTVRNLTTDVQDALGRLKGRRG